MNVDRLLENASPTIGRAFQLTDRQGHEIVVAVAKLTLNVTPRGEASIAVPPSPVRWADEPYIDLPATRFPSDVVEEKPGTDVLLAGHARPPSSHKGGTFDVRFRVGALARTLRVFGPRVWIPSGRGLVPGPPAVLAATPLAVDPALVDAPPVEGAFVPALEDAEAPGRLGSVGVLPPTAESRRRLLGTMDAAWANERAPVLPADFDPRYYNVASPGLWSATPLASDAPVEVIGATPEGRWAFQLPRFVPRFFAQTRDDEAHELSTHLDTFLVDADEGRVELTWRASVRVPRKAETLRRITIVQGTPLPEALYRRALDDLDRDIAAREKEASA